VTIGTASITHNFTEPTLEYWQALLPAIPESEVPEGPFRGGYPVRLPCGRILSLPLRVLPSGDRAVASLIANQASFAVIAALADHMADLARAADADIILGLPTLGLAFAPLVAERLGHRRYVPLGYSRKFWYDEALSEPVSSVASPSPGKRVFLDPNLLPLVTGRRVVLVDDAISSGTTTLAACRLLTRLHAELGTMVVAMKQTNRWQRALAETDRLLPTRIQAVFGCPLFRRVEDGWAPLPGSLPPVP
jgi:adenine/guanine phosphoribosyltransferase-like PRPP-binding protein